MKESQDPEEIIIKQKMILRRYVCVSEGMLSEITFDDARRNHNYTCLKVMFSEIGSYRNLRIGPNFMRIGAILRLV